MRRSNRWWTLPAAVLLASSAVSAANPMQGAETGAGMVFRGTVGDEAGKPVAGAMVDLLGSGRRGGVSAWLERVRTEPVQTGPDGGFLLRSDRPLVSIAMIRATADGGARLGVVSVRLQDLAPVEPVHLVLKPSRPVAVRVADDAGKPVAGAAVEVTAGALAVGVPWGAVDPGATDDRGVARFRVPADAPFQGVLALKDGVGVDWSSNPVVAPEAEVSLVLRGTRTITFRALDSGGRPIPGVVVRLDGLTMKGGASLRAAPRITEVRTDASGIARWRWVPEECYGDVRIDFMEDFIEDAPRRLSHLSEGDVTWNVLFRRRARLSGRVVNADGSPARGVMLNAQGVGKLGGDTRVFFRSGEDGSYTVTVRPEQAYLIAVTGPGLAAEPVSDVVIGEGERHDGLDFRLIEGTRLHGRAAFGPGVQPYVMVNLLGEELPADQQPKPGAKERLRLRVPVPPPDAQGRYEARLGPGDYEVIAASHRDQPTIHVDGTGEFVLNFLGDPIPPPTTLTGVVVEMAPGGGERPPKGGAGVQVAETSLRTRTDEAGRFAFQRPDRDVGLYARSAGSVAAVKVAKGVNEIKVVLGPWATASGRVVDAAGRPLVGEGPRLWMSGGPGDLPRIANITYLSKFEPGGRYEFKGLFPGAEYRVFFPLFRDSGAQDVLQIKTFRVPGPGPIDLGEFVVPAEKAAPR